MAITGTQLRRLTNRARNSHGTGRFWKLLEDVYTAVLAVAITVAMIFGIVDQLNVTIAGAEQGRIAPEWLGLTICVATLGLILAICARLGPLAVGGGQATWWLPTSADRRGLLRPRLFAVLGLTAIGGLVAGIPAGILLGGGQFASAVPVGLGLAAPLIALVAMTRQQSMAPGAALPPGPADASQRVVWLGDGLLLASIVPLFAGFGVGQWSLGDLGWWPLALLTAAVVALTVVVERRLNLASGAQLRTLGSRTSQAYGALTSIDTRELGLVLDAGVTRTRRRSAQFSRVSGPVTALLAAEATMLMRNGRHLLQILAGGLTAMIVAWAGWSVWLTIIAIVFGGILAASALGGPARVAHIAPVLDALMPLTAKATRGVRLILPCAVMTVWLGTVLAATGHTGTGWIAMTIAAGPVFGAGVVRSAYRKGVNWSGPLIANPLGGALPPGAMSMLSVGPDIVILLGLPLWLAIGVFGPTSTVIFIQLATTAIALAIAAHVREKS